MQHNPRAVNSIHLDRPAMADFYEGLEALSASSLQRRRAQHAAFCNQRLQALEERAAASGDDTAEILAESAIVRIHLAGECLFPDGHEAEAIEQGETALNDALASRYQAVIFDCLGSLGYWYLLTGHEDRAVTYFQRAIAYAFEPGVTSQRKSSEVLSWLGAVWSRRSETLSLARMTAQWRRSLEPYEIGPWRDEFIWLIQHRRQSEVEDVLAVATVETCEQAAEVTAALLALGRYEAAMEAARGGRSIALAIGDDNWSRTFDEILSPEVPAIQGR